VSWCQCGTPQPNLAVPPCRESEAEFIKERDESLPGHEWERICRLCEFNPKNNRSQKDASRMRSILLQLKQNPTVQAKVM
jgi:hypothetical protein